MSWQWVTLCPCRALRALPGLALLCVSSLWGLWDSLSLALPVQPSSWALKETARLIQGLEKPHLDSGFGGEAPDRASRKKMGQLSPSRAQMRCQPIPMGQSLSDYCNGKLILPRCFCVDGLFPPLSLVLKLA